MSDSAESNRTSPLQAVKDLLEHTPPALSDTVQKAKDAAHKVVASMSTGDSSSSPSSSSATDPVRTAKLTVEAAKNVVAARADPQHGPHSAKAQRIVMMKGVFDIFLSLSLILFPGLLYDGPIPRFISKITPLTQPSWLIDAPSAFALSALIMGAGVAGICAAESTSDDAYKAIATLNGVFAAMSLAGCALAPRTFGSSFLLLAGLQDVFWFYAIVEAGNYGVLDTLGMSAAAIKRERDRLLRKHATSDNKRANAAAARVGVASQETVGEGDGDSRLRARTGDVSAGEGGGVNVDLIGGGIKHKQEGVKLPQRHDSKEVDDDLRETGQPGNFGDYRSSTIN